MVLSHTQRLNLALQGCCRWRRTAQALSPHVPTHSGPMQQLLQQAAAVAPLEVPTGPLQHAYLACSGLGFKYTCPAMLQQVSRAAVLSKRSGRGSDHIEAG